MQNPSDYSIRFAAAMREAGKTPHDMAAALGVSYQAVMKVTKGTSKMLRADHNAVAARFLGVSSEWLATGKGAQRIPQMAETFPSGGAPLAELSSSPYNPIPTFVWGDELESVRGEFRIAAPDDAMAPRVRAQQMVVFSAGVDPRPGDGVLVVDAGGVQYFRQYQQRRPGHWQAVADNPAFQPLDSAQDGLRVLAVLIAVEARWA